VLDLVGASYLAASLSALGLHGRLVCIATQGGAKAELDLNLLLHRRLTLIGSTLRTRTPEEKAALCARFAQRALPRFAAGELRPVLAKTFPLANAGEAHALLARNEVVGKLVLKM
jgi:NADPH2:quinone reductase